MSVSSALTALQNDINAAREAIAAMGGTVTTGGGSSQLASDIATIHSGASLNIAYGSTAPSDTTKLWVESDEPSSVKIGGVVTNYSVSPMNYSGVSNGNTRGCAVVGNYIYEFGTTGIYKHDFVNKTVTQMLSSSSFNSNNVCASAIGTNIYISIYSGIYKYDTNLNTISKISDNPSGFSNWDERCSFSIGNNFYICGGYYGSSQFPTNIYCLNTTNNELTVAGSLQYATTNACTSVIGTKAYIIGGYKGTFLNYIQVFDSETNTCSVQYSLPEARTRAWSVSDGNLIYIFGGEISSGNTNHILLFDTISGTINKLDVVLPSTCQFVRGGAITCNNHSNIYIISSSASSSIYRFIIPEAQSLDPGTAYITYSQDNYGDINLFSSEDPISFNVNSVNFFYISDSGLPIKSRIKKYNGTDWEIISDLVDYLNFSSLVDNTMRFNIVGTISSPPIIYWSKNKYEWNQYTFGTDVTIEANETVYWKGDNRKFSYGVSNYISFESTAPIYADGNIMTLLDSNESLNSLEGIDYAFISLFQYSTTLVTPPRLPATTLSAHCYQDTFSRCTSLISAPELPATVMKEQCYYGTFFGCTSLEVAPYLPSNTLSSNCYGWMFSSSTSLNEIRIGYTGNFSGNYFNAWVDGLNSSGDFYYNGSDTTRSSSAIPSGWTIHTF